MGADLTVVALYKSSFLCAKIKVKKIIIIIECHPFRRIKSERKRFIDFFICKTSRNMEKNEDRQSVRQIDKKLK